jgi:hypothetical protein
MCPSIRNSSSASVCVFVFGDLARVVSIVSMLRYRRSGVRIQVGVKDSSLLQQVQTCSLTHPVHYSMDTRVRRPEREVNHTPHSSAKDKNSWSPTSTPRLCLQSANKNNNCTILFSCFLWHCYLLFSERNVSRFDHVFCVFFFSWRY